ncbi:MAG: glycosyltransferase family 2 protein [Verrucomicrobia bacterium]|nr:glycosyltransferase family 2 protein [Verrucomicrobiota bacterium]
MRLIKLLCIAIALVGSFAIGFSWNRERIPKRLKKVRVTAQENKPFVIIIPSYNNRAWVDKNLRAVFEQKYDNYRVIYIDDASTDGTYERAQELIAEYGMQNRVELIRNEENVGAAENLFRAVHSAKDQEIILLNDGDDFLAHDLVLTHLNEVYADPEVWLTYGSYVEYPSYSYTVANFAQPLPKGVLEKNQVRHYSKTHWALSHLHTFYAQLFKAIELKDLFYEGKYCSAAADVAYMIPMVEMAGKHAKYLDEILYLYNRSNPLNDTRIRPDMQRKIAEHIFHRKPYQPLAALSQEMRSFGTDLIVFSYDRPLQLYALLESIGRHVKNLSSVQVLYRASDAAYAEGYDAVKADFPNVEWICQSASPTEDFQPLLMGALQRGQGRYVLFAVDDDLFCADVDLDKGARALAKTGATGFYYRLGLASDYCYMQDKKQSIPPLNPVEEDLFAWSFAQAEGDWNYPHSVDLALYPKQMVVAHLEKLQFSNPNTLESEWAKRAKKEGIGLCQKEPKIVNIPLNIVHLSTNRHMEGYSPDLLLSLFNQGMKIDISKLIDHPIRSAHSEFTPTFIKRV